MKFYQQVIALNFKCTLTNSGFPSPGLQRFILKSLYRLLYNSSRVLFTVMSVSSNEKDLEENLVTLMLYVLI